jgi:hypothetical protein
MADLIARRPEQSLPRQAQQWADLKAAYRFLNNDRVQVQQIGEPHRTLTFEQCARHSVVLCVQDDSDLCAARIESEQYVMHSTLAVVPTGQLLGLLQQRFFPRVRQPSGETRKQRAARWRESDVWEEAVQEIGSSRSACRFIHVADRAADNLRFMHACVRKEVGFVVRAKQDRRVNQATDRLWAHLAAEPSRGVTTASVGTQRNRYGRITRRGREAKLAVRWAPVALDEPWNCHEKHDGPLRVNVVYLSEIDPPAGVESVEWMLLSSEPVNNLEQALTVVRYYLCRWVIEEWHRALKEGCRLEESQLEEGSALMRLTAVLSVIATRLIQLRDLAENKSQEPEVLRATVPPWWIVIVSALAKIETAMLTPQTFWQTIARQGGWLGRKGDGRPGWKAIWFGWREVHQMVKGAELAQGTNKKTTLAQCG